MALPSDVLSTDTFGTWRTKTNQIKDNVLDKTNNLSDLPNVATARTNLQIPQAKHDATVDPTANNDTSEGYSVGSHWTNVTDDKTFFCLDATAAAAVWREVPAAAGLLGTTSTTLTHVGDGAPAGITGLGNSLLGYSVGTNITTGAYNIGVGVDALDGDATSKLTGDDNIGIGYRVGYELTSGALNIFLGGDSNTAQNSSGYYCTTGVGNIGIGAGALRGDATSKFTGNNNIGIGRYTGDALTTGYDNILMGVHAGSALTTGYNNILLGDNVGNKLTTGNRNIFIGADIGINNFTDITQNVIIGHGALGTTSAFTFHNTVAIGTGVGPTYLGGAEGGADESVIIGAIADSTSDRTVAIGYGALTVDTGKSASSVDSIAIGHSAFCSEVRGVAIGSSASAGSDDAISIGSYSYAGSSATAIGSYAYARRNDEISYAFEKSSSMQRGYSSVPLKTTTTSVTPLAMSAGSGGSAIDISFGESLTVYISVDVLGRDTVTGNVCAYNLKGVFRYNNGTTTTSQIGTTMKTIIAEQDAAFDVNLVANDTSDVIDIEVTAATTNTTEWTAVAHITETYDSAVTVP